MCDATFCRETAGERTDTASGIYLRSELVSERCRIWLAGYLPPKSLPRREANDETAELSSAAD